MIQKYVILLVVCLQSAWPIAASDSTLTVTHLANEGAMIESGDHTILIDAVFWEGIPRYQTLTDSVRRQIVNAQPPFDDVRLLLITHQHADHFDAATVASFLQNSPNTTLIAGQDVLSFVRRELNDTTGLDLRVSMPPWKESEALQIGDISIRTLRMRHGGRRSYKLHHLGFQIQINGFSILHVGDVEVTEENLAPFAFLENHVNLALLPYWMLGYNEGEKIVKTFIQPDKIAAIHFSLDDIQKTSDEILKRFPNAVLFTEAGRQVHLRR